MDDKKIARINELYHKSKSEGLTAEEKAEYEIIGCENIVIYDTILINVNILTMEVLF